MEEDSNSKSPELLSYVKKGLDESAIIIEPPLTIDIGDVEVLIGGEQSIIGGDQSIIGGDQSMIGGDQSMIDAGAPRTPTSASRISISELIRTLTQPTVGLFPQGVAPKDLFDFMCKLPEDQRASKSRNHLQVLLWRDVKLNKICRVGVGVYTVPEFLEQIMAHHPTAAQPKGGHNSSSSSSSSATSTPSKCSENVTASNAVVSTTSRSSPPSMMTKEEQDSVAWQIINDTISQSSQLVQKTYVGKRKKPKKECKLENRENTPQMCSADGDSNEKSSDAAMVSSTTPTVDGTELAKPKRKRAKKNISSDLSTTSFDDSAPICFFCKMPGSQNIFGQSESFICCKDCQFKAHPSCLGYDRQLTEKCKKYPWQCFDCKQCSCCGTAENAESMLMCDSCDRGYHMHCHTPIIKDKPLQSDKWLCADCLKEMQKKLSNGTPQKNNKRNKLQQNALIVDGNKRQIEISNTVESICGADPIGESAKFDAQLDKFSLPVIDDNPLIKTAANEAKIWTVEQVYNFISQLGFPEQANAFKREEIDGQALLLLKRNDVLSMLSLKLGPALKIHRRLSVLQSLIGENEPEDH